MNKTFFMFDWNLNLNPKNTIFFENGRFYWNSFRFLKALKKIIWNLWRLKLVLLTFFFKDERHKLIFLGVFICFNCLLDLNSLRFNLRLNFLFRFNFSNWNVSLVAIIHVFAFFLFFPLWPICMYVKIQIQIFASINSSWSV